ncbi:hypothetical protein [Ramlibacter rhizophilus]|uniref:Uncharacterized protein n=1 Tax=Ramlibacter rhizophilus TaxID=1781167 RepID=A0A4Z0BB00_9BURK|nr:hypothetical protein [Ramlibacter rhizophilus]TFY96252.1 hypothetical protein EZ242_21640 [Ramlibacter rhizophilus]
MDTTQTPSSRYHAPTVAERTDPAERQQHGDMSHIPGWGADLDRAMRPAVPMERTPPRLDNVHWDSPAHQQPRVEVLHSIERPGLTPVFGTSAPPSGLSGRLRHMAYRWSENDLRHWMTLLLADRINVGEGLIDDLAHGHVPNVLAEMGARAEWKHNRAGFVRKALVFSALVAATAYLLRERRD